MSNRWTLHPVAVILIDLFFLATIGYLGWQLGLIPGFGLAIIAGFGMTLMVILGKQRSPVGLAAGSVATILTGLALVGAIGLSTQGHVSLVAGALLGLGVVIASFGVTAIPRGAIGHGQVLKTVPVIVLTAVPLLLWVVYRIPSEMPVGAREPPGPPDMMAERIDVVSTWALTPEPGTGAVLSFAVLIVAAQLALLLVIPRLTVLNLLAKRYRHPLERGLTELRAVVWLSFGYGTVLVGVVGGTIWAMMSMFSIAFPPVVVFILDVLRPITTNEALRVVLLGTIAGAIAGLILSIPHTVNRVRYHPVVRWAPATFGGVALLVVGIPAYQWVWTDIVEPQLRQQPEDAVVVEAVTGFEPLRVADLLVLFEPPLGPWIGIVSILAIIIPLFLPFVVIPILSGVGLFSDSTAPGTVAAAGLIGCAMIIGAATEDSFPAAVAVISGIFVWEMARFAKELVDELGGIDRGREPLVIHAIAVGALSLVALVGVVLMARIVADGIETSFQAPIGIALTLALLLVFIALKIRARRDPTALS